MESGDFDLRLLGLKSKGMEGLLDIDSVGVMELEDGYERFLELELSITKGSVSTPAERPLLLDPVTIGLPFPPVDEPLGEKNTSSFTSLSELSL